MMRRTALLVAVLAAAAFAYAPSALAAPIPGSADIPLLVPAGEPLMPHVSASVHVDAQAELAPIVHVAGEASVEVHTEEPAEPVKSDGPAEAVRPSTDVDASGSAAPIAAASVAVGLFAVLAFGIEAVRAAASSLWAHGARIVRGAARLAIWLPLFSRIARADLLENPVRASIHAAVTENPGLSLTDIQSCTGIAWGTAVHHLQRLEKNGLVVSATKRAHRRYFIAGSPAALRRNDIAVMVHPTARRIAMLVSVRPGIDQTGICRKLGLNNPAASKHLCGFEAQGLVFATRDGRNRLYHPTPSMAAALPFVQGTHIEADVWAQQHAVQKAPLAAVG